MACLMLMLTICYSVQHTRAQKYRQGLAKIQGMGGAGRGGRGGVRGGAYGTMMGCASGLGGIAMNPGLAAQLSTPAGQREYLNSQLQQVRWRMCIQANVLQAPCICMHV